ncbi:MAG: hypothetical protein IMZ70_07940 [Candidatus Atribacteria bacterium]|nr:hypothetical protein [Candidatus Atribacteria bacterium]
MAITEAQRIERNRRYYEKNKEKVKARVNSYRNANKEKVKVVKKVSYQKNKDKVLAKCVIYYEDHKAEILAKNKEYRIAHAEEIKQKSSEYHQKHKGELKAQKKLYKNTPKGREVSRNSLMKWRKNNPEKYIAHRIVQEAIRLGVLIKQPCICGEKDSLGHHPDYSKPLEVVWLCDPCHKIIHQYEREKNNVTDSGTKKRAS